MKRLLEQAQEHKFLLIIYVLVFVFFGAGIPFMLRDSKSLIEGGIGEWWFAADLLIMLILFLYSIYKYSKKAIIINTFILFVWFIFLFYFLEYGWYVLN